VPDFAHLSILSLHERHRRCGGKDLERAADIEPRAGSSSCCAKPGYGRHVSIADFSSGETSRESCEATHSFPCCAFPGYQSGAAHAQLSQHSRRLRPYITLCTAGLESTTGFTPDKFKAAVEVINDVMRQDFTVNFLHRPTDVEAPSYSTVITRPREFTTIRKDLISGAYLSLGMSKHL